MCGIFAYIGDKQNAGELILKGLKSLEYRGYDSWGVAAKQENGSIFLEKHTGKIGQATLPSFVSTVGFGHTRWATHGGVTEANAHPHTDCTKEVIVVHNGIVENYAEIKKELLEKGHTFISETDTEVVAHLIEEEKKNDTDLKRVVLKTFQKMHGMSAIIVFFPKEEVFYAIKNGSPVVFGKSEHELIIASDSAAIIPYTKTVYFLEDNDLLEMKRNIFQFYDIEGNAKDISLTTLQYDVEDAQMGAYPHFLIKEIHEQPKVLTDIVNNQKSTIQELAEIIRKAYGTYFIGCGSAYYVALAGAYIFSKVAKRHVNCWSASEFSYIEDFLKDTSLVVPISQSGETIDVISSVRDAQKRHARIMAITNVLGSTLYRIADNKILLNAGPEIAVVSTKVFTAKIAVLLLLAHELNGTYEEGKQQIEKAIIEVEKLLKNEEIIKAIAQKLNTHEHLFTLGRGLSYPAALESAMKIKEVSYMHAEGFAGGDLKHGPLALIDKGTPVLLYNPTDETYEDMVSSSNEVKARGGYVIGVSSKQNTTYDEFIQIDDCAEATIIPNVVVAQLMGYYLAVERNLDPDKPRNLAKSVTVK